MTILLPISADFCIDVDKYEEMIITPEMLAGLTTYEKPLENEYSRAIKLINKYLPKATVSV